MSIFVNRIKYFVRSKMVKHFMAFTLAEVLITLGIIGVVAAMTIPTLLTNIQDRELKTALRKQYSILSQATSNIKSENNWTIRGAFSGANDLAYSISMREAYAAYLKVSKSCDNFTTDGCFSPIVRSLDNSANAVPTGSGAWLPAVILTDGVSLIFNYSTATTASCQSTGFCGQIWIDVNGFKKPNIMGRDVFVFNLKNDRVEPVGIGADYNNCESTTGTYSGANCTAKYIFQRE